MHLLQDSPGGGRGKEDRKCHPPFTDLGSQREHIAACIIPQMEKSQPKGGKSLVRGPGNWLRKTCDVHRVPDREESPRVLVLLSYPSSKPGRAPAPRGGVSGRAAG